MEDKRLYQAGWLAIPLKADEDSDINPKPNFVVIENVFGREISSWLGSTVETPMEVCTNVFCKVVYREMLPPAPSLGRPEQIREVVLDDVGTIKFPSQYYNLITFHEALRDNVESVNEILSLFQFRGFLEGYKLELDEDRLLDFLTPIVIEPEPEPEIPEEEPEIPEEEPEPLESSEPEDEE